MYGIEEKTKNMFGFDETVEKLELLGKFTTVEAFRESEAKLREEMAEVSKIKDEFERYVPKSSFDVFREHNQKEHDELNGKLAHTGEEIKRLEKELGTTQGAVDKNTENICINSGMIKEINFPEML